MICSVPLGKQTNSAAEIYKESEYDPQNGAPHRQIEIFEWSIFMSDPNAVRVLIIDDNELTRSLLQLILRSGEYNVVGEAIDAKTGLEMAKKLHPQVVLLDQNMPNGNGVDILPPLRTALPDAVILMVTTQSDERIIRTAMERGANGFVVKPFNTASVHETMRKASQKFLVVPPARLQG